MKGTLKSVTVQTSQEAWRLDRPEIIAASAPGAHGPPQETPQQVPISTINITSPSADQSSAADEKKKRAASTSEPVIENEDDDFMPPTKHHPLNVLLALCLGQKHKEISVILLESSTFCKMCALDVH